MLGGHRARRRDTLGHRSAAVVLAAALVTAGCRADPEPVLVAGAIGYTAGDIGILTPVQRERLGDLTAFGIIVAKAELVRFGAPFIEREEQAALLRKLALEVSVRRAGLDEAALRALYREAPETELVVRHIVILAERWRTDEERARARAQAEQVLERARSGADFAALAAEFSDEPGAAERGGLLQPGREGTWVDEFWTAASALEVGEISEVVETRYGFHVLELEERRVIPFAEVRDRVLGHLLAAAGVVGATENGRAWADRRAAALEVHPARILRWRTEQAPDSTVLAAWSGGDYRGSGFRRYLSSLESDVRSRVERAGDSAYVAVVAAAARNALLADAADSLGLTLSAAESDAIREQWLARATAWALVLGFREGLDGSALKAAAIAALGATTQDAAIARTEILARAPALRALYSVSVRAAAPERGG